jgi:SAM-dependent methyltransferase
LETDSYNYKIYLQRKYLPGRHKYLKWVFFPKILKQFCERPIVDLGCGSGEFLKYLRLMKRDSFGVDSNKFFVEELRKMGLSVMHDNITTCKNIPSGIQNALCDNVLEHLSNTEINNFFIALKKKMSKGGKLVIIVPDKKGFQHDPTHKTYIEKKFIENICSKHSILYETSFNHPLNLPFVGQFFYLNMQVFILRF